MHFRYVSPQNCKNFFARTFGARYVEYNFRSVQPNTAVVSRSECGELFITNVGFSFTGRCVFWGTSDKLHFKTVKFSSLAPSALAKYQLREIFITSVAFPSKGKILKRFWYISEKYSDVSHVTESVYFPKL